MPTIEFPSPKSQVFSSNGTWVCPGTVTHIVAVTTGSGTFNALSFIGTGRLHVVTPGNSYPVVVSSGTITVHWFAVR